jgi:hypothetical protein
VWPAIDCARSAGKQTHDLRGHPRLQLQILADAPLGVTLAPAGPRVLVGQARSLGALQRLLLDQDPLTLKPPAAAAEAHDHRPQAAARLHPPRQFRVPRGQEYEVAMSAHAMQNGPESSMISQPPCSNPHA